MKKLLKGWEWENKDCIRTIAHSVDLCIRNTITITKDETRIRVYKTYGNCCVTETKEKIYDNEFILMLADIIKEKQREGAKNGKSRQKR